MGDLLPTLVVGVVAGLIAAVMAYLGRPALASMASTLISMLNNIVPILSHGRIVRGRWETTFKRTQDGELIQNNETARLSQIGGMVYGEIINISKNPNRKYKMRGTLREGILVATYETVGSNAVLDRGAFTLKLNHQGNLVDGFYAWTDDENSEPSADHYEWRKIDD